MLSKYQDIFTGIKEELDNAVNPLFIFDRDMDGLCSYIVLKSYAGRGNGVVIKSSHEIDNSYLKEVRKFKPDKIFILDISRINQGFVDSVKRPIVIIDHHPVQDIKGVKYFNPMFFKKNFPTTYLCYKATRSNLWIATLGSITDFYYPEFASEFKKLYPNLLGRSKDPGRIIFNTRLGKLIMIISFNLKGTLKEAKRFVSTFEGIRDPYEILDKKSINGKLIYKKFSKVEEIYKGLLSEALDSATRGKLLCFTYYVKKYSLSSELSNELYYKFPNKVVVVGRDKGELMVFSLRSKKYNVLGILGKVLKEINGIGGGHEHACGCSIKKKDFPKFAELLKENI